MSSYGSSSNTLHVTRYVCSLLVCNDMSLKPDTEENLQAYDWEGIASQCNSTKGACSKRYSRLKLAFERGDAPPSTPGKSIPSTPKKTPHKCKGNVDDDGDGTPSSTPKRKRTPTKKVADDNNNKSKPNSESDDEEDPRLKRVKSISKLRLKPKPKNAFRASDQNNETQKGTIIAENEVVGDDDDVFLDAPEQAATDTTATDEEDQVCRFTLCSPLQPTHSSYFMETVLTASVPNGIPLYALSKSLTYCLTESAF